MSPDDRQPADHRNQTVDSMRIIRNVDNTRHRIALGTLEAAEGFIFNTPPGGLDHRVCRQHRHRPEEPVMWRFSHRFAHVMRLAIFTEYDRPLITTLVVAKSPALTFGRSDIASREGFGGIARTVIGTGTRELEWLEMATDALGGHVGYMAIHRTDSRAIDQEIALAVADSVNGVGHAAAQAAEGDAILNGERRTGRPDTDHELRRIVEQGRAARRHALDRDTHPVEQYVTGRNIDQVAVGDRHADRQRHQDLRDEYAATNGGQRAIWPF